MLDGKFKLRGAVDIHAVLKVHRVFGGKAEGGYTSVVKVFDENSMVELDEFNGPRVPYIDGVDPLQTAYVVLNAAYPQLKADQTVELSPALVAHFADDDASGINVGDKPSWLGRIKTFFGFAK